MRLRASGRRSPVRKSGGAPDYGFRLRGRSTSVLPDRSFDLAPEPGRQGRAGSESGCFSRRHRSDVESLQACLQCGVCTASCDLTDEGSLFPRRQLTLVRLGLEGWAAAEPGIWKCYSCGDCTLRCPSGAKPAGIMRDLRQLAIEHFAYPAAVARALGRPRTYLALYLVVAAFLAALVAASGSFVPGRGPIDYAGMLPNPVLIPVFCLLTVLPLAVASVGVARAWRAWCGTRLRAATKKRLWAAHNKVVPELVAQRKMSRCGHSQARSWAHRAVITSLAGLLVASGVMAFLVGAGKSYPLPMTDPLKVLSNVFAGLLIGGTVYFFCLRYADRKRGERANFFDWAFLVNVFLAGVTGVLTEVMRVADVRAAAYPALFVHLVVVLVLILSLPYTKLAHAAYRVVALTAEEYQAMAMAGDAGAVPKVHVRGQRRPASIGMPAPTSRRSAEEFLQLSRACLAGCPDHELAQAYYELRDRWEHRRGKRYYPNLKLLSGTALEREKDRREVVASAQRANRSEWESWYEQAADQPCTWWLENDLIARHALTTCLNCGMCTSVCPAAEHFEEYDPRVVVDTALSGDEDRIVKLLESDVIWYCAQCGSCNSRCPHNNDIMNLVASLRTLSQLKGYHTQSVRGRQQYATRHLWGGNLWNRAVSLYFRDPHPAVHPDFGPRYESRWAGLEEEFERVGGQPDMDGTFGGRKVAPETLAELRSCIQAGGALVLWRKIEEHAVADAARRGLDIDDYLSKVSTEG